MQTSANSIVVKHLVYNNATLATDVPSSAKQFSEMDPIEVADQVSLIEYDLLRMIRPNEFLKQAWNKDGKEKKAPNILRYIYWFNKLSRWVSTVILKGNTPEERSVIISKFIQIGLRFRDQNNYNGIMEVISSLHSSAISRLKKSWAVGNSSPSSSLFLLFLFLCFFFLFLSFFFAHIDFFSFSFFLFSGLVSLAAAVEFDGQLGPTELVAEPQ